ncbi:Root cap [Sesbania bispinosa]|nr:Root cap [Sesbania bispinosa]
MHFICMKTVMPSSQVPSYAHGYTRLSGNSISHPSTTHASGEAFAISERYRGQDTLTCNFLSSPCFGKKVKCPAQCPLKSPSDPNAKVCFLDCTSPVCKTHCRQRKPNCNGRGSACLDPRFVGPDGTVFYFHGKRNEHFSLVSDANLQVNARSSLALGLKLTVEATPAATWDDGIDHLKFSYNGEELVIPEGYLSTWESPENQLRVERTSIKNSVTVSLPEIAEISVNVVPVTQEDSRIHNYQIPDDDCFAHLEVQFKFYHLSSKVDGVLGRTYQPDFQNPAKLGVAMSVLGGEDSYRTTSLLSADCGICLFATSEGSDKKNSVMEYGMLDCTGVDNSGNGIVCRR